MKGNYFAWDISSESADAEREIQPYPPRSIRG
jgi:hypothetical protein